MATVVATLVLAGAGAIGQENTERAADQEITSSGAGPAERPAELPAALTGGLIGSQHDFTQSGAHPRDLCLPCHTPYLTAARALPLDDRAATTPPIELYQSGGLELDGRSLLCLGCHGGAVAPGMDARLGAPKPAATVGFSQLDRDAVRGHPVGVRYPAADPRYHPIAAVTADGRIRLPGGRVQCTSCHDPHNTERRPKMLVKSNDGSQLCLSCHRFR